MPPRIPAFQCLRAQSTVPSTSITRAFSSTPSSQASTVAQRRKHRDPYAIAQAKARKAANLSRQEVLKKERAAVLGDPVRGNTTPFVQSFDTGLPPEPSPSTTSTETQTSQSLDPEAPGPKSDHDNHLNFFLSKEDLESGLKRSQWLTQPLPSDEAAYKTQFEEKLKTNAESRQKGPLKGSLTDSARGEINTILNLDSPDWRPGNAAASGQPRDIFSEQTPEARQKKLQEEHDTAQEALRRISSLSLGNSKDRTRVNIQRCIDTFGRHNTDQTLPGKLESSQKSENAPEKFPRIGADTGSSEVQIAILTAKIRTLADSLELRGYPDKMNKRNLRLLVHRRAKLLKYLRKKDRAGPRWQHLVETLGLTDGTWKGEISM